MAFPRASLKYDSVGHKVMKLNITYIIDPNEYISTVYIPKI